MSHNFISFEKVILTKKHFAKEISAQQPVHWRVVRRGPKNKREQCFGLSSKKCKYLNISIHIYVCLYICIFI